MTNKTRQRYLNKIIPAILMAINHTAALGLESMDDTDLDAVIGQSLFTSNTSTNGGFVFYRLGVDAQLDLNVNVKRLALGCDGANGTGICDIDIDRVRLAGIGASSAADSGPGTDFMLRRPFIEFAIKNNSVAATREVSGVRIGAMEALGTMTLGENANITDPADDIGINRLSGDMTANIINATFTNVHTSCVGVVVFGVCIGVSLSGSANVNNFSQQLVFRRDTAIADIGPMTAQASGSLLGLTLSNTHLTNEPLRTIHEIKVMQPGSANQPTKDFYISLQKESITWQKISTGAFTGPAAEKGWWLSIPQVVMANITSGQFVEVGTFAALGGAVFGSRVDIVGPVDLGQRPVDNCWGNLTFC